MAQKKRGRRAADTKVRTPLSDLTDLLRSDSNVLGKRAAVAAAGAGLALSVAVPTMSEAGNEAEAEAVSTTPVEDDFKAQDKVVAEGEADGALAGAAEVSAVTAAKAPEPEPEPQPEPEPSASSPSSESSSASSSEASSSRSSGSTDSTGSAEKASSKRSESSGNVAAPSGTKAQKVVSIAKSYVGTPYVWGGTSPSGWDCSGFTSYVYRQVGVNLPRSSGAQKGAGKVVPRSQAKPGDLMWHPGHVGIYTGNGKMVDARNKRKGTVHTSASWMSDAVYIRVL